MLTKKIKCKTWILISLFVAALLVRSAVFFMYLKNDENYWQVDSNTYHLVALGISEGKGVALSDGTPNFYRLPGYPIFLSACYKLFGPEKVYALWVQIVLASLIPILIYFLAMVMFGSQLLASLAGVFAVFHLGLVLYSGFFMSETLFILFFLLFILIFLSAVHLFFCKTDKPHNGKKKIFIGEDFDFMFLPEPVATGVDYLNFYEKAFPHKPGDLSVLRQTDINNDVYPKLFLAGSFLGVASLIRPVGHFAVIIALILIFFANRNFLGKLRMGFVLFVGWILPVSFWLVRNYMLLGHIFFHTLPGGHFLYLSAARVAMHVHNCSYQEARDLLSKEVVRLRDERELAAGRRFNEIELCNLNEDVAVKYFKQYPLLALKNWTTDMFRAGFSLYSSELLYLESGRKEYDYFNKNRSTWSLFERYLFPKTESMFLKFLIWAEIIIYFLTLLGVLLCLILICFQFFKFPKQAIPIENMCTLMKSLPWMAFFIVIALSGGYARMRLPIEPFLIIFALFFWLNVFKNKSFLMFCR